MDKYKNRKEKFIQKAIKKHGDKYNYSRVIYTTCKNKVIIICNTCNKEFLQTPDNHLQKKGCPYCSGNSPYDFNKYKESYKTIHNNFYEYLGWFKEEKSNTIHLRVKCKIHNEFVVRHIHHLNGIGCKRCVFDKKRISIDYFLSKIKDNFNNYYSFSNLKDIHTRKILQVFCPKHGIFERSVKDLINGYGCYKCFAIRSIKENDIYTWILSIYPSAIQTYKPEWLNNKSLDIYIPELKLAIEYNGTYWHSEKVLENKGYVKIYHKYKYELCRENGINLIHIFEFENLNKWKRKLKFYFENPDKYTIYFKNNKRLIEHKYICYGQSYIKLLEN